MSLGHVTIFIPLSIGHLFKDIGLFAAGLAKVDRSISTVIHGSRAEIEVPHQLQGWVKTYRIDYGYDGWRSKWKLLRLLKQGAARSVTLYHATRQNLFFALLLRMSGLKVYLKLDMSGTDAENLTSTWRQTWRLKSLVVQTLFGVPNLVSCEDADVYRQLKAFPWSSRRLQLIPNAMLKEVAPTPSEVNPNRLNIIVIVGRLGTKQKNSEMVLRALAMMPLSGLGGWQLHFCGPSTLAFREMLSSLLSQRPDLQDNIVLRGELDREKLTATYFQSKVLLVTSRFEGFSLAALEAAWAGCFLVSTPVGGMAQLTDNWRLGYRLIDDDAHSLAVFLRQIVANKLAGIATFECRQAYVHREFALENYAAQILATLRAKKTES
jgi:glycosyltransferase involved in cell wall biosynthesis